MTSNTPKTPEKIHRTQLLSGKWPTDPIKKKYVSGKIGETHFTCKICQVKLKCESFYDHVNYHEKGRATKSKDLQTPSVATYSTRNIKKQHYEFEISKFIVLNNLSY